MNAPSNLALILLHYNGNGKKKTAWGGMYIHTHKIGSSESHQTNYSHNFMYFLVFSFFSSIEILIFFLYLFFCTK